MDQESILAEVVDILSTAFKVKPTDIELNSKLDEDLGLDSVDIMDSIGLFEDRFKITILTEDLSESPRIETVQDLVNIVKERKK